jgi:uncharacterized protein (DUF427 family)
MDQEQQESVMKAKWHNVTLAESFDTLVVDGFHYFPRKALNDEFFQDSESHIIFPRKGKANYFDVVVHGERNKDAAWYYPEPRDEAKRVKGYVGFSKAVDIVP